MKRLSLALGALLAVGGVARDGLECAHPKFQAGQVRSGAALTHTFDLVNAGADEVRVLEVKPGCGCLRPAPGKGLYKPGERGGLRVEVNTVTQAPGPNTWRVLVRYAAGGREHELPLFVVADVVREVAVAPASLVVTTDAAIRAELTLTDWRARPLGVRAADTTSRHVRAVACLLSKEADLPRRWAIALEVLPDCPEGRHEEVLHVHTTDRTYPELKVPFTVVKKARRGVTAVPAAVSLTAGAGPLPARVVLLGADGAAVEVARAEADSPAVTCTWAQGPGDRATLRVQVDRARVPPGGLSASVRVHVTKPAAQTLTVPVRVTAP